MNRKQKIIITLTVLVLVLITCVVFHRPLLTKMAEYVIVEPEIVPSDLIVVVSGSLPEIHYGMDLYHQGYGEKILFLGHFPVELAVLSTDPFEVVESSWDEIAAHMALNAGIPVEALLFSDAFTPSTYERAEAFIAVAQQNEIKSILVVSDQIHSRRLANSVAHITEGTDLITHLAPTPQKYYPPAYRFDSKSWWTDEADFKALFNEYIKLAFYTLKY